MSRAFLNLSSCRVDAEALVENLCELTGADERFGAKATATRTPIVFSCDLWRIVDLRGVCL